MTPDSVTDLRERCVKMAAARQEFQVIWQTNVAPSLKDLRFTEIMRIEEMCFITFLCVKKIL